MHQGHQQLARVLAIDLTDDLSGASHVAFGVQTEEDPKTIQTLNLETCKLVGSSKRRILLAASCY